MTPASQSATARARTAEQLRRLRSRRVRRERLASISLAVALAVTAFFLELGLNLNVTSSPYLVPSFLAVLISTIVGGPLGGIVAAVVSWALTTFVLAARIPAEPIRPILDGINSGLAFVVGLLILEARRRPIRPPNDDFVGTVNEARVPTDDRRARILASAVDDLAASRSTAQIADVLARRLVELTGAGWVAVFVRPRPDLPPALRATAGAAPTGLPDRLEAAADPAATDTPRDAVAPGAVGLTIPILVGRDVVGAAVLGAGGESWKPSSGTSGAADADAAGAMDEHAASTPALDTATGATAVALARLAGSAIERDRLIASGRAATDAASDATGRVTSFSRLAAQLGGALSVDAVGRLLVEHAVSELGAEFGLAYAVDRSVRAYRLVHARGYPIGLVQRESSLAADVDGPVTRAAHTGKPVEIGSPEAWRREFPAQSDLPAMTGMRSLVAWPLGDVSRSGGVLVIGWAVAGAIDTRTREVLAATADQGGQAFERAGLHAQEREAQQLQEAFISVISHELRTPITTILAGSRLLRRRLGEDPTTDRIAGDLSLDIEAEADRLFRIVEDLLVLSRLERRNLSITQEPVHVTRLAERVVASESRRWPSHTFVLPERVGTRVVRGEETYIEQVLRNLLANAAKYSPAGSTVEIVLEDHPDGVAVRVLDDGPGIARAEV
ncbi:MAG TPA: histidine kinase dimerization/phospho-acceptor domain-containing protein, partial [Candidatus Limnocylindrales bacterium]|nr:histidine kinase dimerization/phospho-acceptor domain-containing protein [Candidatus Limnocylindrales bacterium]